MQVLDQLRASRSETSSAVAIGNFDGVHRGHRAILKAAADEAVRLGVRSVAITFDPHPLVEIAPERAPVPITTLDQRIRLIEGCGIDVLLVQTFDDRFRRMPPEEFVERFLIDGFHARSVTVGYNFRFGYRHSGDFRTLERYRDRFSVQAVPPVLDRGVPISSTLVRRLIAEGHVGPARRMLGRCYEIEGSIVPGAGRGRAMTIPTLNIEPVHRLIPRDGVYLTGVAIDTEPGFLHAVTNIGIRPTFDSGPRTIETHVLDQDIEGAHRLRIRFLKRLRDEMQFKSADRLRAQIGDDINAARIYFRRVERWALPAECGSRA